MSTSLGEWLADDGDFEAAALWAWPPKETARERGLAAARRRWPYAASELGAGAGVRGRRRSRRAIDRVEAWYAKRGLASCFQLTDRAGAGRARCRCSEQRGYARTDPRVGAGLRPAGIEPRQRCPASSSRLATDAAGHERGLRSTLGAATRRARAELFARIRRPHIFAVVLEGIQPVAGRCAWSIGIWPASSRCARRAGAWQGLRAGRGARGCRLGAAAGRRNSTSRSRTTTRRPGRWSAPRARKRAYGYWYRELDTQAA